jgi:predicted nucleic acid-binding protein
MILVDSSVWINALRHVDNAATQKLNTITSASDILIADLVMMEVLMGARDDIHARKIELEFQQFKICNVLNLDVSRNAAQNFRRLRNVGISVRKKADMIIGTYCIMHGHALLHSDRDFEPMVQHLGLIEY